MARQKQKQKQKPRSVSKQTTPITIKKAANKDYTWYWVAAGLLLVVFVYFPSLFNGASVWDDTEYLNNPYVKDLSLKGIVNIFSIYFAGNYHPLTLLSLGIDGILGGGSPFMYHLTNLMLHLLNSLMVFLLVKRLFQNNLLALLTFVLFGVHTMHVESVAWVAERKDVLYTFFFLLSLVLYTSYATSRKFLQYSLAFLFFILSLLSKGQAVVLVALLPLIDYVKGRKWLSVKVLSEKAPFLLLSLIFAWVAFRAQASSDYVHFEYFSLPERFAFASFGFTQYLVKSIMPTGLSALYPYPARLLNGNIPVSYWFYIISLPVFFAGSYFLVKRSNIYTFGLGMFFLGILPLLQLIPVGGAIMADRYFYIPSVGLLLCFAAGLLEIKKSTIRYALFILFTLVLSFMTYSRCSVWKDNITLWEDEVRKNDAYQAGFYNLGIAYYKEGEQDKAIESYSKAIDIDPKYTDAYFSRGLAYDNADNLEKAITDYSSAIEFNPKYTGAYVSRGVVYGKSGQLDKSIADFSAAIGIDPEYRDAYTNRGVASLNLGQWDNAIADCTKAIEIDPQSGVAYENRGVAFLNQKQADKAIADFTSAINIDPKYIKAYNDRGFTYNLIGQYDKAVEDYSKVIEIDPNNGTALAGRQSAYENLQSSIISLH